MARAETMESVAEARGGGNGPLPCHNTCRMELPRPFHPWPGLLTTTSIGTIHHHHLHPLQALFLPCPLPYLHPEGLEGPQTHRSSPPFSPSSTALCNEREESGGGGATPRAHSGERTGGARTDSDMEQRQEASSQRGPLPDLLPQNEHPSWASLRHRAPGGEVGQELEIRRVGSQLRAIGDDMNATILRRAQVAPQWQDWRDVCRGLLNFITQTLSTLYRLT